ncbi:MAG: penicillin acylase family protein [Alphaproteobacteria bacterium]|nr:MAG: penicillin acylase family protein [Alphaproteobacteria bacterium]
MAHKSAKIAAILAITLTAGLAASAEGPLSTAVAQEDWKVRGLTAPAEIVVDHWGIPHIFAGSTRDAYFLQGYNAARDRLWQIDLWRKRGLGLLSKSFGPSYVEQDRAARLFLYRGDMTKEWQAYAPKARASVEAFTAGINAYIGDVRAQARPLPIEFKLTGSTPEEWRPEDVLRIRSHALVSNVTSEVTRARVACAAGVGADELRRKLDPVTHKRAVPAGLNPCDIPKDVLKDYELGTRQVEFEAIKNKTQASIDPQTRLAELMDKQHYEGSNNWVVAPSKTETGRPILANDPHRTLGVPSLRYVVGLNAPGINIIGAGEPALPGVSIGHNADIAFGITIFAMDQEDLYVYDTNPSDPNAYRYNGKWEKMTVDKQMIDVRGEAPREIELRFTRHGPVLSSEGKNKAFAIRTIWQEPGLSGYFGSSRLTHAKTWDDFKDASHNWGAPPLNLVYADTKGNVGWAASGLTPVRKNWDGLMPVPGDGRYEWQGFFAKDMLPSVLNPKEGFFASANEYNLPSGYPAEERKVAFEWADPTRSVRIKEVLAANPKVSLLDSMKLQTDTVSAQARRFVKLLKDTPGGASTINVDHAIKLLTSWDGNETVDSPAAAIYEVWALRHLGKAVVARVTPAAAREIVGNGHIEAILTYLEKPDTRLGPNPIQARNAIFIETLKAATDELAQKLGGEPHTWTWGRLHQAKWDPAISVLADPQLKAQMSIGPLQTPGSASTPRAQSYRAADFNVSAGASVRMVMDVGAWDNSVVMNTPGQSGDPYSAHYRDLFPLWAEGRYVPLAFSREAVDRVAEKVIRLTPAN